MTKQNWIGVGCLILAILDLTSIAHFNPHDLWLILKLFAGLTLLVAVSLEVAHRFKMHSLRRRGLYPASDKATMKDVEALVKAHEKIKAIQLYRKIYRVSLQDALFAINQMQAEPTNAN